VKETETITSTVWPKILTIQRRSQENKKDKNVMEKLILKLARLVSSTLSGADMSSSDNRLPTHC